MSEEDSQNLRDIKLLLQEINEKTSQYMNLKINLETEYGEKLEDKRQWAISTGIKFWEIDAKFKLKSKEED